VASASDHIGCQIHLQRMECDPIGNGRVPEIRPDVTCRHGDASVELMCRSKGFDHGGGHAASFTPMTLLEHCHRPGQLAHRKHLDLAGRCDDLRSKPVLDVGWQPGYRCRQLAGHIRIGIGGAEPEEPETGDRYAVGGDTAQVRRSLTRQDVTEQVVVDDDGCHLRGRQIGIVELADELEMLVSCQCVGEELLTSARGQEDHRVAQIDHGDATTVVQPPPMPHGRRHRHLATGRDEKLG